MKIYVGNLSQQITDFNLREAFTPFGQIASVEVVLERETGRNRGFGYVEMPVEREAQAAISGLNRQSLNGRALTVQRAVL